MIKSVLILVVRIWVLLELTQKFKYLFSTQITQKNKHHMLVCLVFILPLKN